MTEFGKLLLMVGIILSLLGILSVFGPKIPCLGRFPGDVFIKKGNFTFYFPLATCILISIIVTLILSLLRK